MEERCKWKHPRAPTARTLFNSKVTVATLTFLRITEDNPGGPVRHSAGSGGGDGG